MLKYLNKTSTWIFILVFEQFLFFKFNLVQNYNLLVFYSKIVVHTSYVSKDFKLITN